MWAGGERSWPRQQITKELQMLNFLYFKVCQALCKQKLILRVEGYCHSEIEAHRHPLLMNHIPIISSLSLFCYVMKSISHLDIFYYVYLRSERSLFGYC